jgi:hypothetical protein
MFQFDAQGNLNNEKFSMFLFINYQVLRSFSQRIGLCNVSASMKFKMCFIRIFIISIFPYIELNSF